MTPEQLQWLLLVASNAPIANTGDARNKAVALIDLAERLDEAANEPPDDKP